MAIGVNGTNGPDKCDFCRRGAVLWTTEKLRFTRDSDRGQLRCQVSIEIGRCNGCKSAHVDAAADKVIEDAVRRVYSKLPPKKATELRD